jgi:hypothetical protein
MEQMSAHGWVLNTLQDIITYAGVNGLPRSSEALREIYPELEQELKSLQPNNVVIFPIHRLR